MATVVPLNWGRIVLSGVIAGIAGGVCLDIFIYVMGLLPGHASIVSVWQFIASTGFGKVAYTSASYAWAGALMQFCVAIGWAIGYAYIAHARPGVNKQPLVSGFIFGVVVWAVMQFVLFSVQALPPLSVLSVYLGLAAATVFFGIPVAFVARAK